MKFALLTLFASTMLLRVAAQNSIGMTIGQTYNWGTSYSFSDVLKANPNHTGLDSASHSNFIRNSGTMKSGFMIGAYYRVAPKDTLHGLGWSKSYHLNLGYFEAAEIAGFDQIVTNINAPYTTIFQGDTTKTIVDSMFENIHYLSSNGFCAQAGFSLHKIIPTETRVRGELGFGVRVGYGTMHNNYSNEQYFSYVEDSTTNYSQLEVIGKKHGSAVTTSSFISGQFELSGGLIIPLAKDDDTWWISFHGALGIGGVYMYEKWLTRMSFTPTFGIHFQLLPKKKGTDGFIER
jgi:hypothetical protein